MFFFNIEPENSQWISILLPGVFVLQLVGIFSSTDIEEPNRPALVRPDGGSLQPQENDGFETI